MRMLHKNKNYRKRRIFPDLAKADSESSATQHSNALRHAFWAFRPLPATRAPAAMDGGHIVYLLDSL